MTCEFRSNVRNIEEARRTFERLKLCFADIEGRLDLIESALGISGGVAGITNVYFEATLRAASGTSYARLYDLTANAPVVGSDVSTTSATRVRVRSSPIVLTIGHEYEMQVGEVTGDDAKAIGGQLVAA